jgi:hypothetical protein
MNPSVLAKIETVESNRWEDGSWNADISSKEKEKLSIRSRLDIRLMKRRQTSLIQIYMMSLR